MNVYKKINSAYDRMERLASNKSWNNPVKDTFKINLQDERNYRNNGRNSDNPQFTANAAAKLFTLKHIFEGLTQRHEVKNILHLRLSCYYGEAIAHEYNKEITAMFSQEEINEILAIDYAELMRA